ncbi:hypothetical protein JOM56_000709 [Amanita muscaria]
MPSTLARIPPAAAGSSSIMSNHLALHTFKPIEIRARAIFNSYDGGTFGETRYQQHVIPLFLDMANTTQSLKKFYLVSPPCLTKWPRFKVSSPLLEVQPPHRRSPPRTVNNPYAKTFETELRKKSSVCTWLYVGVIGDAGECQRRSLRYGLDPLFYAPLLAQSLLGLVSSNLVSLFLHLSQAINVQVLYDMLNLFSSNLISLFLHPRQAINVQLLYGTPNLFSVWSL